MGEVERFVALMIAASVAAAVARWIRVSSTLALLLLVQGLTIGPLVRRLSLREGGRNRAHPAPQSARKPPPLIEPSDIRPWRR